MSYEVIPNGALEQGDIIRHVGVIRKAPAAPNNPVEHHYTPVIVLSHGCEIDKPIKPELNTDSVLIACVFKLITMQKGIQGDIRKNRVANAAYLPGDAPLPEECYVDWRTLQPVDKALLLAARASSSYLCTVTGDVKDRIAGQFWEFLFRPRPRPALG